MGSTVTLGGEPIRIEGNFPRVGDVAHSFMLVDKDMKDVSLSQFAGKRKVLNIVTSLDTSICLDSARKFNASAGSLPNTVVLVISADTPFAQKRACDVAHLDNVIALSTLRGRDFHKDYGVMIAEPPLSGLLARSVVVLDENDKVVYAQLVPEIKQEPNYQAAIDAILKLEEK